MPLWIPARDGTISESAFARGHSSPKLSHDAIGGSAIQDHIDYRRHRNACKYYREDWRADDALYRCICLLDMPPETLEEQELCLKSRRGCWRFHVANAVGAPAEPAAESEDQEVNA